MTIRTLLVLFAVALVALQAHAADWPAFRGPAGNGIATDEQPPIAWSPTKNIKWKAALPQPGNGSAIVSRGLVFVTSAQDRDGKRRTLYCFDRKDGGLRWEHTVTYDKKMSTHKTNPYCGTTPASNGKRVVVWHASAGLMCYDFEGELLWSRDLGEFKHIWGYGSSPVIHENQVILNTGPGKRCFLTAIDLENGTTVWEAEEPFDGDGEKRADGKYMGSWSTPVLARIGGQEQILCSMPTRVVACDPVDGKILWSCDGLSGERGDLAYSSPILADDICVAIGGYSGPGFGVNLGRSGNITARDRLWRTPRNPQSIGSGIFYMGHIYRPNASPNTIDCLEPKSGKINWTERTGNAPTWASIVLAGGHCYATNQDGATFVFRPDPKSFDLVSKNELGEPTNATLAVSDDELFIRTSGHLFCIAH